MGHNELPEVGSKWEVLVDGPQSAEVKAGEVVVVKESYGAFLEYSSSTGRAWVADKKQWHKNFRPLETEKAPTELTAEASLGMSLNLVDNPTEYYEGIHYTPKDIKEKDNVNSPSHYGQGSIEAIEYIKDVLTNEEYIGYLRGNIAKYLHRWPLKGKPLEDLQKAGWYLDRLIGVVDDE